MSVKLCSTEVASMLLAACTSARMLVCGSALLSSRVSLPADMVQDERLMYQDAAALSHVLVGLGHRVAQA